MTRWTWTAADGSVTELGGITAWSADTYLLGAGTTGQFAPPYEFASQQYAGVDGATLQQITAQPAQPLLAMDLHASDPVELRSRVRALTHALRPRAGVGVLTAQTDDGTAERWLPCYYQKGIEAGTYVVNRFRAALQFWSPSPWWRGDALQIPAWSLTTPAPFFPFFPLQLSATSIAGAITIDLSDTDAPTYPTWTVTGPGSQLTLSNGSTGQSLVLNYAIGDGRTVTIDTRPGYQSVRLDDGTNLFGSLASDPAMWPLIDGVNTVSVLLTNAGAHSSVAVAADRLYSGAL